LGARGARERLDTMKALKTDYDTLTITENPDRGSREWYLAKRARKLGYTKGGGRIAKFREIAKHKPITIEDVIADRMPRVYESEFWFHVWNVGQVMCVYCGDKLTRENRTQDHVIPRAKGGGRMGRENLVPACQYCNWAKADLDLLTFLFLSGPASEPGTRPGDAGAQP
jgi:hypothetical protein